MRIKHKSLKDAVFAYLIQGRDSKSNWRNIPASAGVIAKDLGEDRDEVEEVCEKLASEKKIEKVQADLVYYRVPRT